MVPSILLGLWYMHMKKSRNYHFKLSFEYFWKYYWKWSICSKIANAPFSMIFSNTWYFKGVQRLYYGVKGLFIVLWKDLPFCTIMHKKSRFISYQYFFKNEPAACLKIKQLEAHLMALWSSIGHMIHVGCLFVTKTCILLLYLIDLKFLAVLWLSDRVLVSWWRGCMLQPHMHRCVVSLGKSHYWFNPGRPVQTTEKLLTGT